MKNFENKFKDVLTDDEKVLWVSDVNKQVYLIKTLFFPMILWVLFIVPIIVYICCPIKEILFVALGILAVCLIYTISLFLVIKKNANNTYLCLTDKRIIKRFGIIKTDFQSLGYDIITQTHIQTSLFDKDKNGEVKCANLILSTKMLTPAGDGTKSQTISVISLNNVYEANKIILKEMEKIRKQK